LIEKVLKAASETKLRIIVAHNEAFSPEISSLIKKTAGAINAGNMFSVRGFATLVSKSKCVISPDSGGLHFAAAFNTPALGLWGHYNPDCRALYYPLQKNIWHPEACKFSPCYSYVMELPFDKCPEGKLQKHCACYDLIPQTEISEALSDLLKNKDERRSALV
jgi:ADP-heptose:LPS heptosyltransferase